MTTAPILIANPKASYDTHRAEILDAIHGVLDKGWYILGEKVTAFEQAFAQFLGATHCTGVANGTDALALALRAVGVSPGDEVITVSHSAVATVAAIEQIGAVPVFADIHRVSRCLDPINLEPLISSKTKAIVPVHIYGQAAEIKEILTIAKRHNIRVVEDCAQAHGAQYQGKYVGTFGDAAAFSFYPTKNLGALGDGGAVVTSSSEIAENVRLLRQYGWKERYVSDIAGVNSRLDELQAAILLVKLGYLANDNEKRRQIAARFRTALAGTEITAPADIPGTVHAMHLFVVECERRNDLKNHLSSKNIQTGFHYPLAIHQQPAYRGRIKGEASLTNTNSLYQRILTLPLYPELSDSEVQVIQEGLQSFR